MEKHKKSTKTENEKTKFKKNNRTTGDKNLKKKFMKLEMCMRSEPEWKKFISITRKR